VNLNSSAQSLITKPFSEIIGKPAQHAIPDLAGQLDLSGSEGVADREITLGNGDPRRVYDVDLSPLVDKKGAPLGTIVVMRDITDRKHIEEKLLNHREKMEELVRERTSALTEANSRLQEEITEREEIEQEVRSARERYERILSSSHDSILVFDEDGRALFANKAWYRNTGYTLDEVKDGNGFNIIVYPDDLEKVKDSFQEMLSGEAVRNLQYRRLNKKGEVRWVESNASLINWPGTDKAIVSVARDITERKQAEEELRLSEERYRKILDSCHDMITVIDENTNLLFANRTVHENTGYTLDDIEKMDGFDTIHEDDREMVARWFLRVLNGEAARSVEYRGIHKSGETRWVESNADQIFWDQGQKAVVNVLRDITKRKRDEETLRESEQRFRSLVEATSDWIWEVDHTGHYTYVSPKVKDLLGYEPEELIGKTPFDLMLQDEKEQIGATFRDIADSRQPFAGLKNINLHKDGRHVVLETNGVPIMDGSGDFLGYRGIDRDITAKKKMEEELRVSEERYRRILDSSHDMIVVVDEHSKMLYANKAHYRETGHTIEEINAGGALSSLHEEDHEKIVDWFQRVIAGETIRNAEYRRIGKDGKLRWMMSNVNPISWPGAEKAIISVARDITERKQVEEALKESEQRYRTLIDSSLTGVYLSHHEETWFANRQLVQMLGYTEEELLGMSFQDIIHPDDRDLFKEQAERRTLGRSLADPGQFRAITKSGDIRYIEAFATVVESPGDPEVLVNIIDVTERKRIEEELRASEKKYRSIFENIQDVYGEVALDGTILEISPSIKDIGGYTREELLGKSMLDYHLNPDSRAQVIEELLQKGRVHEWEFLLRHKNGHVLTFSFNVEMVTDEEGIPIKTAGIMRDITERKRMEEELKKHREQLEKIVAERTAELTETVDRLQKEITERKRTEELLQQSEKRYRGLFEESRDTVYETTADGRVIDMNAAGVELFGYSSKKELLKEVTISNTYFNPNEREKIRKAIEEDGFLKNYEMELKRKDGKKFIVLSTANAVRDNSGAIVGYRGIMHDITGRKEIEYQLQQSNKLAAIGELAAGVAHEINNPIAVIDIQTGNMREIIEEQETLNDAFTKDLQEYFSTVENQVQRCRSVTEDLLSFARGLGDERRSFEINELLEKTVKLITSLTEKKPRLEMILDDRLPLFEGDPNRLQQVFVNLLTNAIKAVDDESLITIATNLDDKGNICIKFGDSGCGMAAETRQHIFDPFFTTRPEGEGTGLGLSISYYIVRDMNGTIDVDSAPGQGTTFIITLPRHDKQSSQRIGLDN